MKIAKYFDPKKVKLELALPTVKELLDNGVHFGHETKRWNPKMNAYIYTKRAGVHILDLAKTLKNLEVALKFVKYAASRGDIAFVGTKRQAYDIIREGAEKSGSHYVINRWAGGLLTNFSITRRSLKKMVDLEKGLAAGVENRTKQEVAWMKKDLERLSRLYEGVKHMSSRPTAVFVVDAKREKIAVKEARKAGIPVIALVDTNTDPDLIDFVIPGNDDSVGSLQLIIDLVVAAVMEGNQGKGLQAIRNTYQAEVARLSEQAVVDKQRKEMEVQQKKDELKKLKEGKVVRVSTESPKAEQSKAKKVTKKVEETKPVETNEETKIESLGLSTRINQALVANSIDMDKLKKMSKSELADVKGIGPKAIEEIFAKIEELK